MIELHSNPYRTPDAELSRDYDDNHVLLLGRFSAWGVFGLNIITLGIYPVYWMYSRAKKINAFHDDKISPIYLNLLIGAVVLSTATIFFGQSEPELIAGASINIFYLLLYLIVLFKIRNRLQEIINRVSPNRYRINILLTFFFFVIYLQYKINECIDDLQAGG